MNLKLTFKYQLTHITLKNTCVVYLIFFIFESDTCSVAEKASVDELSDLFKLNTPLLWTSAPELLVNIENLFTNIQLK